MWASITSYCVNSGLKHVVGVNQKQPVEVNQRQPVEVNQKQHVIEVNQKQHVIEVNQKRVLEMVVKTVLNAEERLDVDDVVPRLVPIIESVTKDDFTSPFFLPSISRNVLRSPETSLEAVVKIIPLLPLRFE